MIELVIIIIVLLFVGYIFNLFDKILIILSLIGATALLGCAFAMFYICLALCHKYIGPYIFGG